MKISVPTATADAVDHADWLETLAIHAADRNSSHSDLARALHRGGTIEVLDTDPTGPPQRDGGDEKSQAACDTAWMEIERRANLCGDAYPFEVTSSHIQLVEGWERKPYAFLLLLSQLGQKAGPQGLPAERLFEESAVAAARQYFGGAANGVKAFHFAFPRPTRTGFRTALADLLRQISEGQMNGDATLMDDQKDSHLDVVSWVPFADGNPGQLIAFGQCATGSHWRSKTSELEPKSFQKKWLVQQFVIDPIRMFFIPHSVEKDHWTNTSHDCGLLFERCRMSIHLEQPPNTLADNWQRWTAAAAEHLRTA